MHVICVTGVANLRFFNTFLKDCLNFLVQEVATDVQLSCLPLSDPLEFLRKATTLVPP